MALDLPLSSPDASPVPDPVALSSQLSAAGYAVDPRKIAELSLVLAGALAGPKGTRMEGQTSVLSVVDVASCYERCTAPALPPSLAHPSP